MADPFTFVALGIVAGLTAAGAGAAGVVWFGARSRDDDAAWLALLDQLSAVGKPGHLGARVGERSVELRSAPAVDAWTWVDVGLPELPADLTLAPRGSVASAEQSGDDVFDEAFSFALPEATLGAFDARARAALRDLGRVTLGRGHLHLTAAGVPTAAQVHGLVALADHLAGRLVLGLRPLVELVRVDPCLGVRARALEVVESLDPNVHAALARELAARADPVNRALGLLHCGGEEGLGDALSGADDGSRVTLARLVAARASATQVELALDELARAWQPGAVAVGLARALRRCPTPRAVARAGPLARHLRASAGEVDAVVHALAGVDDAGLEEAMLTLLPRCARAAPVVVRWLCEHGTVSSVAALEVLERGGDRTARTARRAIQSRASGRRGDLALADVDGGEVAIAASGAGTLSPPTDP